MSIWGKIIGGTAGFALGGPIGAILGVMAGNVFDKSKKNNYNKISSQQKQNIFALSIIILSAKIAKSDGIVTKDEISAFKEKFNIPSEEMDNVSRIFNEAKKSKFGYEKIANQVGLLFNDNKILLEELLNNLFYIAEADGKVTINEVEVLKSIGKSFHLTDEEFQRIFHSRLNNKESDPFKVLGVSRNDTDESIRKKWISLNKEHHPDNLLARGLPEEFINQSNKELSSINHAYDKIKKLRENN
ncbi:MAG: Co-chaperone protein DjlA [Alphaproteobacteria bacterium MarineAlpha5_Bin8]|nr:MAG: Co-chaperone protein DjlA [Alphaproteobacteria bacterium MarineAlpha5_Bin7]PPR46973.1 MAG: Co-chaperone protein DjlA [Alphaproteobacteria bacterium MarineAlpha5_Bin8]PPR52540.1 MAG: Co-chaperone protein DjlA [Alphaproteobacteria bacterium MarineAlpha5_Bin6]|tara:strand:- start:915 stop:1646 length:732 start_codon:yes stop_codon:yes gene_type:complete